MTKEEKLVWQRNRRKETRNIGIRKYEKTPKGFLMRLYRNMQSRVTGVQKAKSHLCKGKSLLPRENFYDWANSSEEFHTLYEKWKQNSYNRKLTPSVDRIDSDKGYELDNMRWITHSENSRLGSISRHRGVQPRA